MSVSLHHANKADLLGSHFINLLSSPSVLGKPGFIDGTFNLKLK